MPCSQFNESELIIQVVFSSFLIYLLLVSFIVINKIYSMNQQTFVKCLLRYSTVGSTGNRAV